MVASTRSTKATKNRTVNGVAGRNMVARFVLQSHAHVESIVSLIARSQGR